MVVFFEVHVGISRAVSLPRFVTIGWYPFPWYVLHFYFFFFLTVLLFVCVGAVFSDQLQADYEAAFRFAIDTINKGKSLLPNTELRVIVNKTATLDAFKNIEMGKWQIKPSRTGNK